MVELSLFIRSINQTNTTVANYSSARHGLFVEDDKSIVARVSNHQQIVFKPRLLFDAEDAAWITQILFSAAHRLPALFFL